MSKKHQLLPNNITIFLAAAIGPRMQCDQNGFQGASWEESGEISSKTYDQNTPKWMHALG